MREISFILIDTGSESNRIMMSDAGKMKNGTQITKTYNHGNKLLNLLIKAHFSYLLTWKMDVSGKSIWNRFCVLNDLTKDDNKEYYIVVVNNAIHRLSVKYLNQLNGKENVHLFSLLLDSYERLPKSIQKMIADTNFEKVYSFQKSDCDKYGFIFTNHIYSRADLSEIHSDEPESDVYFIGADKGRIWSIYSMYKWLSDSGFVCDFTVVVSKDDFQKYNQKYKGINLVTQRIGYMQILRKIAHTKCILELCQEGQDGLTMRFYEALFYNKKLITNNLTARTHPFFNRDFMQVIRDCEDINLQLLADMTTVDYNYENELSPSFFLESLVQKEDFYDHL